MKLTKPQFLFIETTTECNLRCRQCHMWMSKEPNTTLNTGEKLGLIRELGEWAPGATVVLTGGETMQKRDEFSSLTAACLSNNLACAVNTNATLIEGQSHIDELLTRGPKYFVVSLDSHRAVVHDWIRGIPGTYKKVVTAIRQLINRRREAFSDTHLRVMTNTILFDKNLSEISDTVAFLQEIGVDGIMFQALSRTFLMRGKSDVFFNNHFPKNIDIFDNAIDELIELKQRGAPIVTTDNDFEWMKLYVRNPDFTSEQVCGSGGRNMMVDQHGDVQLCFSMRGLLEGRALGNVRTSRLREIWESQFANDVREIMSSCRKNCGMLNCHRKIEDK